MHSAVELLVIGPAAFAFILFGALPHANAHVLTHNGFSSFGCGGSSFFANIDCVNDSPTEIDIVNGGSAASQITDMTATYHVTGSHVYQISDYEECRDGLFPPCRIFNGPVTHMLISEILNDSGDSWTDFHFSFEGVESITLVDLVLNGGSSSSSNSAGNQLDLFFQTPIDPGDSLAITLDLSYPLSGNPCSNCQVVATPSLDFIPPEVAAPEPGTLGMPGRGILGYAAMRRRKGAPNNKPIEDGNNKHPVAVLLGTVRRRLRREPMVAEQLAAVAGVHDRGSIVLVDLVADVEHATDPLVEERAQPVVRRARVQSQSPACGVSVGR